MGQNKYCKKGVETMITLSTPTMLTINQTADRIGLAKHFIRQLCLENKICHVKAGSKYLVNFEKLIDFLNTGESYNNINDLCGLNGIRQLR